MVGRYRGFRWVRLRLKEAFPHLLTGGNAKMFFPLNSDGQPLGDYFPTQAAMQAWIDKQLEES